MRAIIDGAGQGAQGIDAAHLTASYAVELAFRWTPNYFAALKQYRNKLRASFVAELAAERSEPAIEMGAVSNRWRSVK